jgi:hypothetical protein
VPGALLDAQGAAIGFSPVSNAFLRRATFSVVALVVATALARAAGRNQAPKR